MIYILLIFIIVYLFFIGGTVEDGFKQQQAALKRLEEALAWRR